MTLSSKVQQRGGKENVMLSMTSELHRAMLHRSLANYSNSSMHLSLLPHITSQLNLAQLLLRHDGGHRDIWGVSICWAMVLISKMRVDANRGAKKPRWQQIWSLGRPAHQRQEKRWSPKVPKINRVRNHS